MSKIRIKGGASGTGVVMIMSPNTSTDRTVTLPDEDGTLITTGAIGTSADQIVQLDSSAKLPAVDGSQLTNLPAGGATEIDGLSDGTTGGGIGNTGLGTEALGQYGPASNETYQTAIGYKSAINSPGYMNVAVGSFTMYSATSLIQSVAIGHECLYYASGAHYTTGAGYQTMKSVTTGQENAAFGYSCLNNLTTGQKNVAIGSSAGWQITTGSNNTVIGNLSGGSNISDTVLIGAGATERLKVNATGLYVNGTLQSGGASSIDGLSDALVQTDSLGLGSNALNSTFTGTYNLAVGSGLYNNTSGIRNTALGMSTLPSNTTGSRNVGVGFWTLRDNTTGGNNVASGVLAMAFNTTGIENTACGGASLYKNTTGRENAAFGMNALSDNTTGTKNVGLGVNAGHDTTTGTENVFIGANNNYRNSTGNYNIGIGAQNWYSGIQTGNYNIRMGYYSTVWNTSGTKNSWVGAYAANKNTTGSSNNVFGYYALGENTTGSNNQAIGELSLYGNTTGSKNIGIGYRAGEDITTGSNNTVIGDLPGSTTLADTVLIGAGTTERLKVNSTGLYVNGTLQSGGSAFTSSATAPSSPTDGDHWFESSSAVLYVRVDSTWLDISTAGGSAFTSSATAPSSPVNGDHWFDSSSGVLYVRVDSTWLDISTSGSSSSGGGGGWTAIATQTISTSVQTVTFSSLDLSAYSVVRLLISDVVHNNNQYTFLKLSNDGFTTNETWDSNVTVTFDNTTSSYDRQSNGTRNGSTGEKLILTPHAVWANPIKLNGWIDFIVNDTCLLINGLGVVKDDGLAAVQWSGFIDITTFTDLKLEKYTGGTFDSGTYKLLGMA